MSIVTYVITVLCCLRCCSYQTNTNERRNRKCADTPTIRPSEPLAAKMPRSGWTILFYKCNDCGTIDGAKNSFASSKSDCLWIHCPSHTRRPRLSCPRLLRGQMQLAYLILPWRQPLQVKSNHRASSSPAHRTCCWCRRWSVWITIPWLRNGYRVRNRWRQHRLCAARSRRSRSMKPRAVKSGCPRCIICHDLTYSPFGCSFANRFHTIRSGCNLKFALK